LGDETGDEFAGAFNRRAEFPLITTDSAQSGLDAGHYLFHRQGEGRRLLPLPLPRGAAIRDPAAGMPRQVME
jgi:hypothetical protein